MPERDSLHQQLESLPDPEVPEHLWARINQAHKRRNRQWRRNAGIGALVLAALGMLPLLPTPQQQPVMPEQQVATGERTLEDTRADTRLRALDRKLQAAYRGNASKAQIAELWIMREALTARNGQAGEPIRI